MMYISFPPISRVIQKVEVKRYSPLLVHDNVIAVLDIDSPHKEHFSPQLVEVLEKMSEIITTLFCENEDCLDII